MAMKILLLLTFFGVVTSEISSTKSLKIEEAKKPKEDLKAASQYDFAYSIQDDSTGDIKSHSEARKGDVVEGKYSVLEPDGNIRTVTYTVNDGFNAKVERFEGHVQKIERKPHFGQPEALKRSFDINEEYEVKYEEPVLALSQKKHKVPSAAALQLKSLLSNREKFSRNLNSKPPVEPQAENFNNKKAFFETEHPAPVKNNPNYRPEPVSPHHEKEDPSQTQFQWDQGIKNPKLMYVYTSDEGHREGKKIHRKRPHEDSSENFEDELSITKHSKKNRRIQLTTPKYQEKHEDEQHHQHHHEHPTAGQKLKNESPEFGYKQHKIQRYIEPEVPREEKEHKYHYESHKERQEAPKMHFYVTKLPSHESEHVPSAKPHSDHYSEPETKKPKEYYNLHKEAVVTVKPYHDEEEYEEHETEKPHHHVQLHKEVSVTPKPRYYHHHHHELETKKPKNDKEEYHPHEKSPKYHYHLSKSQEEEHNYVPPTHKPYDYHYHQQLVTDKSQVTQYFHQRVAKEESKVPQKQDHHQEEENEKPERLNHHHKQVPSSFLDDHEKHKPQISQYKVEYRQPHTLHEHEANDYNQHEAIETEKSHYHYPEQVTEIPQEYKYYHEEPQVPEEPEQKYYFHVKSQKNNDFHHQEQDEADHRHQRVVFYYPEAATPKPETNRHEKSHHGHLLDDSHHHYYHYPDLVKQTEEVTTIYPQYEEETTEKNSEYYQLKPVPQKDNYYEPATEKTPKDYHQKEIITVKPQEGFIPSKHYPQQATEKPDTNYSYYYKLKPQSIESDVETSKAQLTFYHFEEATTQAPESTSINPIYHEAPKVIGKQTHLNLHSHKFNPTTTKPQFGSYYDQLTQTYTVKPNLSKGYSYYNILDKKNEESEEKFSTPGLGAFATYH